MSNELETFSPAENQNDDAVLSADANDFDSFDNDEPVDLQAELINRYDDADDTDDTADLSSETDEHEIEGEPELAFADIEIDGQTYQVPEAIKDKFMFQQDYTRKTQEVAEMRKSFEQRMKDAEAAYQISQEEMRAQAIALNLQQQFESFQNFDWNSLADDPMALSDKRWEYTQLQEQLSQVGQYQQQLQAQRQQQAEQQTAVRLKETAEFAQKELPNWSPKVDAEITNFAVNELGFDVDTLKTAYNPQTYKALYLAHIGHKTLMRSQTPKPKEQPKQAKPLSKVTARGNVPSGPVEAIDDMDAYAKKRKQQMGVPT